MNNLTAINAYMNQLKLMEGHEAGVQPEQSTGGAFAGLIEKAAQDSASTLYKAEAVQMESLTGGKVDLSTLVTAVANAELTLNTVVAVRDRVIAAYQDIIKMPI